MQSQHGIERLTPRLGAHDHAGSATVGLVVDGAMAIVSVLAQVVHMDLEETLLAGLADKREPERSEIVGEERDDIDPHADPLVTRTPRVPPPHQAGHPAA